MRASFRAVGVVLALAVVPACSGSDGTAEVTSRESVEGIDPAVESETAGAQSGTASETEAGAGSAGEAEAEPAPTTADVASGPGEDDPVEATGEDALPAPVLSDVEVSDVTAFTTPAGAAFCLISPPSAGMAASISCEVAQSSVPPGEDLMGVCSPEGFGWFFNFFADTGHGGFFCNHVDGITRGGGNPHYWRDDPWINPDSVMVLENGTKVAVLDYGRVMRAGTLQCSVEPTGLTCQDGQSGHGFTVNSASYASW